MTAQQKKRLESHSGIGKEVWFKDKETGKHELWGIVEDEVYIMVEDYRHMIQRIKAPKGEEYWDGCEYGYRTGYYTYDKAMKRLVWGQFTQFLTEKQYRELLGKARDKGWPIF